ncbi:Nucleic acid-binding, OB-fold [Sesbania bispinosa]|nr:Nucleic acid-binding, OB-fold [Sesbania bispinosa]
MRSTPVPGFCKNLPAWWFRLFFVDRTTGTLSVLTHFEPKEGNLHKAKLNLFRPHLLFVNELSSPMAATQVLYRNIREIAPNISPWAVRAHVIHIWSTPFCNHLSRLLTLEIVLIDPEGEKIQASILREVLRYMKLDIEEGDFIHIDGARVVPNDGRDRPTRHQYRLVMEMSSMIYKCDTQYRTPSGVYSLNTSEIARDKKSVSFSCGYV